MGVLMESPSFLAHELGEQSAQLPVASFAKAVDQLLFDAIDRGDTGGHARLPLLRQDDQFCPPVRRIGASDDVFELLELVDQLAHRLRRHVRAPRQVGEPGSAGVDLRKDGRVGGPLGETGAHHAVNDLESQQAVCAAEQRNGVDGLWGLCHIDQDSLNIRRPEDWVHAVRCGWRSAVASAIELSGLTKSFGGVLAVDDVSAVALPGEVTALLGPNGAGKTTTLRMLLGLAAPSSGTATFGGRRYDELPDPVRQVGAVLEASGYHPGRTALDHLRILATASRLPLGSCERVLAETGLASDARRRVGKFSLGMRQRLGLASAMLGDPAVLVLDEPTNGLDPPGVRWLRGYVRRLADEGRTVLLSSHALSEVELTADHVLVLAHGRLLRSSTLAAMRCEAGVGSSVRTPDPDRLCAALDAAGHTYRRTDEALAVDATPEQVGELAGQYGIVLHGLVGTADLEQAFFRLIQESGPVQRPSVAEGVRS